MPTLVDSLIITLGLDPSNFNKSQKAAVVEAIKGRKAIVDAAKAQEEANKKVAESFTKVTKEALTLFAVFLGARGVAEFVADMMTADAALGRFSRNLGEQPQVVSAWEAAAQRLGGTAEATASTFERIGKSLYDLHKNGQMLPKEFSQLQAATGRFIDPNHGIDKYLLGIAGAAHDLAQIDPARAHFLLQGIGIDDATANAMIKYGDAFGAYLQSLKKYAPTDATIKNMQMLQDQTAGLQQSVIGLANNIVGNLEPVLGPLILKLTSWVDANRDIISADVAEDVQGIVTALPGLLNQLGDIATGANNVANAMGGWKNVTELLFGLWLGSKFLGVLANVGALAKVLGVGGAVTAAGGGLGGLAVAAGVLGWDAYNNTVKSVGSATGNEAQAESALGSNAVAKNATIAAIRASAIAHGIDPDAAVALARSEGLNKYYGDSGSSFGPFQLHYGGLSSQFPHSGLGDEFTKQTGLDARNPTTTKQQIDFAMQWIKEHGTGDWSGARAIGLPQYIPMSASQAAANAAAAGSMLGAGRPALSTVQTNHRVSTNTSSVQTNINGPITVQTQATDPNGIAGGLSSALRRTTDAAMANYGIA